MRRDILCVAWPLCWVVACWSLATAVPVAIAQEGDVEEADAGVTQETPRRPEMPPARPGTWEPADELKRAKALHELVRQELELRDEQVKDVNNLFEEYLEGTAEQVRKMEAARQENAARIEELQQEAVEARRNRDGELVREISQELRELSGADGTLVTLRREFFHDIAEVLDEEQNRQFRRLAGQAMRSAGGRERLAGLWDLQILRRALLELEPPPEQMRAAMRHFRDSQERLSQARQEGEEAMRQLAAEVREGVLGELDEQQVAALEEAEARVRQKVARRGPRRRPGEGAPPPAEPRPEAQEEHDEEEGGYAEEDDETGDN